MILGRAFLGLVAGAAVGVTAGLLLAPNKGKKTRRKLKKEAEIIKNDFVKDANEVADTVEEIYNSQKEVVNTQVNTLVKKASHKADTVITGLEEALKRVKNKNKKYHEGMA